MICVITSRDIFNNGKCLFRCMVLFKIGMARRWQLYLGSGMKVCIT